MADEKAVKRRLRDKDFGVATFKFNRWAASLDETQSLDDALDPTFWSGQVEKVMGFDKASGRGDVIEIRKMDTGLYAELLVVEVGVGFIKTILIAKAEPVAAEIAENSPLVTKWNAGKKCHEVIRQDDKAVLHSGFQSKGAAADWIADHLKKLAA